ncbi:MAG: TetR/AcrR family transcriptional regulator [Pseudomonadota bacterium]
MARMTREAWLRLGLEALGAEGEDAVTLDAITARAGKTKGSFYHHFKTHDDFVAAMMTDWRRRFTDDLIDATQDGSRGERGAALNALATGLDHRLELAVRRLAVGNAVAAEALRRADGARIAYLKSLQADPESEVSADYALIEYAVFIGIQSLMPEGVRTAERLGALTAEMIAVHWNE